MIKRRQSRQIKVADIAIGGGAPVSVQSMTTTDTRDVQASLAQIKTLAGNGCEIIRLAVPDYRRPVMGTFILSIVLIGISLGSWDLIWPFILIVVGVSILLRGIFRKQ